MLSDFVVAIVAGLGAASVVYALRHLAGRLTGRQLPKWLLPVTAGLAILDVMRYVPCDIATYCIGQASSMGAVRMGSTSSGVATSAVVICPRNSCFARLLTSGG